MFPQADDKSIICSVLQGDHRLFEQLVNRYQGYVFTIALRYARNREDAEEIAQDVFVKAYRSLADFRHDSKFSTWLYTITCYTCITFLRKKKLHTYAVGDEKSLESANTIIQNDSSDSQQKEKTELLHKAIGMLYPDDGIILTLFYKGDQTLEEIAGIMGITPNNAKVKLFRARQRLREKLEIYFTKEVKEIFE